MDAWDPRSTLTRAAARSRPIALACRRLLRHAAQGCDADEATLWMVGDGHSALLGTFAYSKSADHRKQLEQMSVPLARSVIGMVASIGEPISVGPDAEFNRTVDEAVGTTTQAMLAAPVVVEDEVCGVLSAVRLGADERTFSSSGLREIAWWAYLIGLVLGTRDG